MDKYEYQVCADQIKSLIKERRFKEAMDIADTIDWRRVKSFSMLCTVSEIYKITKHYSEARDILLLAYERYPDRPNVVYALCELAIKLDEISDSIDYYKEYVRLKPHDTSRYVLLYKIYDAQDVPLEEKISLLEEYKKAEYTEKWAYELALLYHKDGQETKCVETCDELILWFGEGNIVRKALELKMQHAPLTKEQQSKYDGTYVKPVSTADDENISSNQLPGLQNIGNQPMNKFSTRKPYSDIQVKPVSTDKYSTMNLQEELAKNMEELYARERREVQAPFYGSTSQLYEPSQEQFINQINQAGQPVIYEQPNGQMMQSTDQFQQPINTSSPVYVQSQYSGYESNQPIYTSQQVTMDSLPVYEERTSIQPNTVQISSAQSTLAQSTPVQSAPVQSIPAQSIPAQSIPAQSIPAQSIPVQSIPAQSTPVQSTPVQSAPVQSMLVQPTPVEEQVPGQLDLNDFMRDLEAKKRSGEEQRRAQARKRALENTSDYLAQLVGVIPGIDKEFDSNQYVSTPDSAPITFDIKGTVSEEVIKDDKAGVVTRTTIPSPIFNKEIPESPVPTASVTSGLVKESVTGEIPDILPSTSDILPSGYRTTLEDEYGGEIAKIRKEDEEKVKRLTGELPPIEEEEPEVEEAQIDYGETEDIEDVEQPEIEDDEEEEESEYEEEDEVNTTGEIPPLNVDDSDDVDEDDEAVEEIEDIAEEDDDEDTEEDDDDVDIDEQIKYPYHVEDIGEVEDMEDVEETDDMDDEEDDSEAQDEDEDEDEARQRYEAGLEDEEKTSPVEKKPSRPSYMVMGEEAKSRREFDDSEFEIFGRFDGIEAVKAQLVDVIDDMSMDSYHGNVVVMGSELFDRKAVAIDIVRAIQRMDSSFSGKVAKISGEALKKKNISSTLAKLENGALIVENAGQLDSFTLNTIADELSASDYLILVVLEDEQEALEPLLSVCTNAKSVFDARIIIDDFNDDNLVAYAKGYAREEGYSIDEMGTLALHTRIAEMQTHDHIVSVDEVIDIIDSAIKHVDRKNMSHFMDVILAKRYDDDDYIVLREKDFLL